MNTQAIDVKKLEQEKIRKQIAALVDQYAAIEFSPKAFEPGQTIVPPSGKLIGSEELKNMVNASLDGWLTTGHFNDEFEKRLAEFIGVKHAITVNSGSSANLVAFSALTSSKLGDRAIRRGDEVIGVAAGFPTTVNPVIQFGAVPVFVDVDPVTHNIDASKIEAALSPKTKAIMLAHSLGNPFNLTSTVTAGIVSAKGRNIDILEGTYSVESFIQTDAVVNPGNSGGALIDTEGNLIGINTAIITRSGRYEGYSFAVPVNLARKVAKDLIEFGTVQRGFMGVTIKDITNQMFDDNNLSSMDGVYLDKINSGGAAEECGLRKGDIITYVNDVKVKSSPELQEQVALFRPGQNVKVIYLRSGKEYEVEVKLKNASNGTDIDVQPIVSRFTKKETLLSEMGIDLRTLSDTEKRKMKIKKGLIVSSIRSGGVIAKTNMEKGFVITSVNKKDVTSVDEFIEIVMDASGEVVLDGFYESYSGDYSYVFEK